MLEDMQQRHFILSNLKEKQNDFSYGFACHRVLAFKEKDVKYIKLEEL